MSATSVVSAYLGALYGVAGGTVYFAARAQASAARLDGARAQQRQQHLRGGGDGRYHED